MSAIFSSATALILSNPICAPYMKSRQVSKCVWHASGKTVLKFELDTWKPLLKWPWKNADAKGPTAKRSRWTEYDRSPTTTVQSLKLSSWRQAAVETTAAELRWRFLRPVLMATTTTPGERLQSLSPNSYHNNEDNLVRYLASKVKNWMREHSDTNSS